MEDITAKLDLLCDRLTSLYLEADHLHEVVPSAVYEMSGLERLPEVLQAACDIAENAQSLALLDEEDGE